MHSCEICKELIEQTIRPQNYSPWEDREFVSLKGVNVGWLDSIVEASADCSFCRLIARIWERVRIPDESPQEDDLETPDSTQATKRIYVYYDNATPTVLSKDSIRLHWLINLEFFYPGRDGSPATQPTTKWEPRFTLIADDVPKLGLAEDERTFLLGRTRRHDLPYDVDFLQGCFQTCLVEHGDGCNHPVRENHGRVFSLDDDEELALGMKCIDVINRCVALIPRDGSCRYAVLSYVWGTTNFLLLKKANLEKMSTKGALDGLEIPKTIAQAMVVTKALGIQYIWVDSLCIIQDDRSDKIAQIQKMHKVYAASTLTIVAASANGANDGLWKTSDGTRQPQIEEEVEGLRFISTEPTLEHVLSQSIWKKRAWTYQEYVLSKRMLVFSSDQVYYSCEQGACAEDYVHSVTSKGDFQLHYPATDNDFAVSVDRLLNYPEYWPTLIREYSKREMSYESDGLNAAAGVIVSYSLGSKSSFICGLPLAGLFEYSLLWYPCCALQRRGPCPSGELFPTWSWVGYVGPVSYEDTDDNQNFASGRIIHSWSFESQGKTFICDKGKFKIADYETEGADQSNTHPLKDKAGVDQHLITMQSGILSFQARVARFRLDPSCYSQLVMSADDNCTFTGVYKLYHNDDWVGSVHLDHETAQRLSQTGQDQHDFVALSTCCSGPWYVPERSDPYDFNSMGESTVLYEDDEENFDNPYNVMLVTYEDDGIHATRAGVGQIRRNRFDLADPVLKDIRLR